MPPSNIVLSTTLPTNKVAGRRRGFTSSAWVWLTPAFLILLAYSVFPLVFNLVISLHEWSARRKVFVPRGLENWEKILGISFGPEVFGINPAVADARFGNALSVTLLYTIFALVIQLVLGLLIALLLDSKPWGSNIMQTLLILPMVTAPAVAGLMFRLLEHSEFGLISWVLYGAGILVKSEPLMGGTGRFALLGLLIVDVWQWTPFFILIILAGLKGLPGEIMEAAHVDGANWLQRLLRIKIPLLFGVITVAVLFRLIDLYKLFDYVVIMTSGGPAGRTETISYYSYVNTFQVIKWGYGAAIGVFIMLLGWISAFIYTRVFRVRW
jgi:multiple sugar transport system permease protein